MRVLAVGNRGVCADQKAALKTRGLGSRTEMFCYSGAETSHFGFKDACVHHARVSRCSTSPRSSCKSAEEYFQKMTNMWKMLMVR